MDRRQLLVGIAATSVAGQFGLARLEGQNASESSTDVAANRKARFYPPDREIDSPRGPVKSCIEESEVGDGSVRTTVSEYAMDGKLIASRTMRDGKVEFATTDSVSREVRDGQGKLAKFVSGFRGKTMRDYDYTYDSAGRMLSVVENINGDRTDYTYAADGTKTSVEVFGEKTIEGNRRSAFGGSAWDAALFGHGVPTGGRVMVKYDQDDHGIDLRVLSADEQTVRHMVRTYDVDGRLLEDKTIEENLALLLLDAIPPDQRAAFSPQHVAAMNERFRGKRPPITTYKYDREGRLIHKFDRNSIFEQVTDYRYNEHGDRIEETTTSQENSRIPAGVPQSLDASGNLVPTRASEALRETAFLPDQHLLYEYQYDSRGNWTEKKTKFGDNQATITRRTITYY